MFSLESPRRCHSNVHSTYNRCVENRKDLPKLSLFVSWTDAMNNPQWLELPMSQTNFHGPKDVRAIEVRLYYSIQTYRQWTISVKYFVAAVIRLHMLHHRVTDIFGTMNPSQVNGKKCSTHVQARGRVYCCIPQHNAWTHSIKSSVGCVLGFKRIPFYRTYSKGIFHFCPRMDFSETLYNNN